MGGGYTWGWLGSMSLGFVSPDLQALSVKGPLAGPVNPTKTERQDVGNLLRVWRPALSDLT